MAARGDKEYERVYAPECAEGALGSPLRVGLLLDLCLGRLLRGYGLGVTMHHPQVPSSGLKIVGPRVDVGSLHLATARDMVELVGNVFVLACTAIELVPLTIF
jgi:hypothetical protein